MMKKLCLAISVVALLAGCGSSVPLPEVGVSDKTGEPVTQGSGGTSSTGNAGSGGVVTINTDPGSNNGAVPAASRIVYFDYDSYVIRPEFQSVLEAHARFIKADKARKVVVEGHTDERGGREYNLALGQRRAEAVRRALALLGVPDAQLEAVSFGKEKPAVPGSSEAALEKNRRAEISYR